MKSIISLALNFLACAALAGPPPVSVRAQDGPKLLPKWNLKFPVAAVTNAGGIDAFISTGNTNLVLDQDFKAPLITSAWSSDQAITKDTTAYVGNGTSAKVTTTNQVNNSTDGLIYQTISKPAGLDLVGVNLEYSIWVKTNLTTQVQLCIVTAFSPGSCDSPVTVIGDNVFRKYTTNIPTVPGATYYTISVNSKNQTGSSKSGVSYFSLPYFGIATNVYNVTPPNTFTAKVYGATVFDGTPTGTTWITAVTNPSTGIYSLTTNLNNPNCTAVPSNSTFNGTVDVVAVGAVVTVKMGTATTGLGSNIGFHISCTKTGADYTQSAISPAIPSAPTIQKFTSGSGTYTTPYGVKYIKVRMVGGGGGGGGGNNGFTFGGNGTDTTFGTSLLTAVHGNGAASSGGIAYGAPGGFYSLSAPAQLLSYFRGGHGKLSSPLATAYALGGQGGDSFMAVGGYGSYSIAGGNGEQGSGGGGGPVTAATGNSGFGGGAGGYLEAIISIPNNSYPYVVGNGGAGGVPGANGNYGGVGGNGVIIVEEYYGAQNAPMLVGNITSNTPNSGRYEWATVTPTSAGVCTVTNTGSGFIGSTTPNAAGDCTINFAVPFSSTNYTCNFTQINANAVSSNIFGTNIYSKTTSAVRFTSVYVANGTTAVTANVAPVDVTCTSIR